jgi:FlaA1/EpsC-like NDP-sugar epimerase
MRVGVWQRKRLAQAGWDAFSWIAAVPIAVFLRYDLAPTSSVIQLGLLVGIACAFAYILLGWLFRLYRGRYVVGSYDEVVGVMAITAAVGVLGSLTALLLPPTAFPRTTVIIASGLAATSMLGARFIWRGIQRQSALGRKGTRTLIYGAGDAGSQIVTLMLNDANSEFQPVGFIDDDPNKQHLRRSGIRVLGTIDSLESLVQEQGADTLLVAIAGIPANRLLDLDRRCAAIDVDVRIIPTASEIAGGAVRLGDISDVTEEDLMGRRQIHTDERQITDFVKGKRVLVTGAGGSIGSELVRQLSRYNPESLLLLDRDESALHSVQLTLDGSGTLSSRNLVLADIRDRDRIHRVFDEHRPELVFHAAALKHLPLLERFPSEAYKTNVEGTRNVLLAARQSGVAAFVNISTDKAADPTSVLGYSKLITERLTAAINDHDHTKYVSVRFGNVLGSRGSVLHTFRYQIAKGGPVTVTDRDVTRYFMTVSEAVHLVLQASVLGRQGETLVLDMGTPVRIYDVAQYMIERSGRDIEIVITGLRSGEKKHEVLVATDEQANRPLHPLIAHMKVQPIEPESLTVGDPSNVSAELLEGLATKP